MKVCYFIQSHKNPEQICRLVQAIKISSPNSQVLINHDFSTSYLDLKSLSQFSEIYLIKRKKPARRGNSSILEIYLDAVNWLFEHNSNFEWLICLSGQDYPTQPLSKTEEFLYKTEYDAFISYWDVLSKEYLNWGEKGRKRYFAQYICLPEWTNWSLRKLSRIEPFIPILIQWRYSLIGLETKLTPFTEKFICYGGKYWSTLSRQCVKFLIDYLTEYPELLRYYSKTLAPEESIIQTVLLNSKRFNICNDSKRYGEYPRDLKGYGKVLTVEDYAKITSGDFHFARKFDSKQDGEILNMLDAKVSNHSLGSI